MPDRDALIGRLRDDPEAWDLLVVGGGATGVGTALDAAARGWRVLLLEQSDFGKGTSSRSTKLVHGGVRYLRQGNVPLVREALAEREILRRNAPHHVRDLELLVPCRRPGEVAFYRAGLWTYDRLAGRSTFGRSAALSAADAARRVPNLATRSLRGAVAFHDGQFDDARLLTHLVRTAAEHGAVLLNHVRVTRVVRDGARFEVRAVDEETSGEHRVLARAVVNAGGPFADAVRRLDDPRARPLLALSRGVHVVLDGAFLGGATAVLVPRTEDGRVVFAIPWHGRTLVGTTDTPLREVSLEPRGDADDVAYLLGVVAPHLLRAPTASDVRSVFAGIRPLVRASGKGTAALSREHVVRVAPSGMITVTGGKWTTYRRMAQDTVDRAERRLGPPPRPCRTRHLRVHGYDPGPARLGPRAAYGTDAAAIEALEAADPSLAAPLHPRLDATVGEVVFAVREEMARTVDDVLARRTRSLLLDAAAAREAAPAVAAVLARELGRDAAWQRAEVARFAEVAAGALPRGGGP